MESILDRSYPDFEPGLPSISCLHSCTEHPVALHLEQFAEKIPLVVILREAKNPS
jgi:hypothetical protein